MKKRIKYTAHKEITSNDSVILKHEFKVYNDARVETSIKMYDLAGRLMKGGAIKL
jgi:hypothetical protein|tara:strand:- start:7842 stop:8006 length:165 start_codon:yes stop_codon:yes gene_type:complete